MTQDEWLFKIAEIPIKNKKMYNYYGSGHSGYLNATLAPNVNQVSDVERLRIIEKMKNYWKEHKPSSLEFLVNDAIVNCDKGSILSRVKGKDHGVYTDKQGRQALLNEDDRKLVETDLTVFGSCACEAGKKNKCKAKNFSKWYGVNSNTHIGEGKASLIMSSYMICPYHKNVYIRPVTSGQEFTFTESLFKYPKFVVEQGIEHAYFNIGYWDKYDFKQAKIDMTIIRKLAIRNISIMDQGVEGTNTKGYYERKWIEYLAKYIINCDDKAILCDIINKFYGEADFAKLSVVAKSILLENYNLLLQYAETMFCRILNENSSTKIITKTMINYFLLLTIKFINPYVVNKNENTIDYIKKIDTIAENIGSYYEGGIDIQYFTVDAVTSIRPKHTYISRATINDDTSNITKLWEYFSKKRESLFVEILIINLLATAAIIAVPSVASILGLTATLASDIANVASVVWTVGGSFLGAKLEGDEAEKFEKKRYSQSRDELSKLLCQINVYTIYTNSDEDSNSFSYQVYPSNLTETLIDNFINNISRIYIKKSKDTSKEKCLIDILKLRDLLDKRITVTTKINCLIVALTLDNVTNFDVFEAEDINTESQKRSANTGIKILRNLARETIEDITYVTEIQSGNTRMDIAETICVMGDNVDTSKLFTDILM